MAFFQQEPKKVEPKKELDFRPQYSELKKCVMKKESGEPLDESCKNVLNKVSKED